MELFSVSELVRVPNLDVRRPPVAVAPADLVIIR